jgi:hypothetical protein
MKHIYISMYEMHIEVYIEIYIDQLHSAYALHLQSAGGRPSVTLCSIGSIGKKKKEKKKNSGARKARTAVQRARPHTRDTHLTCIY